MFVLIVIDQDAADFLLRMTGATGELMLIVSQDQFASQRESLSEKDSRSIFSLGGSLRRARKVMSDRDKNGDLVFT